MTNKFLFGIGAAFFAVFALGIGAIVGITRLSEQTNVTEVAPIAQADPTQSPANSATFAPFANQAAAPSENTSAQPTTATTAASTTPAVPVTVTKADLESLAESVKLGAQATGDVSKDVWAKQTPVAEGLLQGMCDCEQRNWLTHFVKTGKEAISGSENYYQSVQLLATLRKSDDDLGAHPVTPPVTTSATR